MVDGMAAARTLLSYKNIDPGMCLHYVWQAYKAHGARVSGSWPTAYAAWLDTPGKHNGDRNPPPGVPVWFGPKAGSAAGDVVISLGDGRVAATDDPGWRQTGSCTIAQRERQIGRPYLGWTETILGVPIDQARPASGGTATPFPKEEDMPLSDEDLKKISNAVWGHQGGALAPLIINRNTGKGEYPADTLGYLQVRVRDEVLKQALDGAVKIIVDEVRKGGASIDDAVVRSAVTAAVEKALGGTALDPQVTAKAVRAEFRDNPLS